MSYVISRIDTYERKLSPLHMVTVSVAPATQPIDTADVKEWLRIDDGDTSNDITINSLIASATAKVQQYANRSLITQTRVATFGYGDTLVLPYTPVQSITSVEKQGTDGAWTAVAASEYVNMGDGRLEFTLPGIYRCTYVAGYGNDIPDVPDEAKRAIARFCMEKYEFRAGTVVDATSNRQKGLSWKDELSTIRKPTI